MIPVGTKIEWIDNTFDGLEEAIDSGIVVDVPEEYSKCSWATRENVVWIKLDGLDESSWCDVKELRIK